jgi:hypothetical protein
VTPDTYIEWLGGILQFSKHEDWYKARREHFVQNGGSALISMYNYSIPKLVTSLLPSHKWQIWRFSSLPLTYWLDKENQREYVLWLGDHLGLKSHDDWYNIHIILPKKKKKKKRAKRFDVDKKLQQ